MLLSFNIHYLIPNFLYIIRCFARFRCLIELLQPHNPLTGLVIFDLHSGPLIPFILNLFNYGVNHISYHLLCFIFHLEKVELRYFERLDLLRVNFCWRNLLQFFVFGQVDVWVPVFPFFLCLGETVVDLAFDFFHKRDFLGRLLGGFVLNGKGCIYDLFLYVQLHFFLNNKFEVLDLLTR